MRWLKGLLFCALVAPLCAQNTRVDNLTVNGSVTVKGASDGCVTFFNTQLTSTGQPCGANGITGLDNTTGLNFIQGTPSGGEIIDDPYTQQLLTWDNFGNFSFYGSVQVANQVTSGTQTATTLVLTGDPITAPASATSFGGNSYTCPSAITGSPSGCLTINVNGSLYYTPYWTNSGGSGGGSSGFPSWWPTVPSTATVFGNLQNAGGNPGSWTICNGNGQMNASTGSFNTTTPCSAGTSDGLGEASAVFGVTSPAQSSGSLKYINTTAHGTVNTSGTTVTWVSGTKFYKGWVGNHIKINGTTYVISSYTDTTHLVLTSSAGTQSGVSYASTTGWDSLMYRHLGSIAAGNSTITNMLEDVWVYTSPGSGPGYEFDPDLGQGGTYAYKASYACYSSSGGHWNVYDSQNHSWDQTTYTCNWNTTGAGAWHHIQLWVTYDQSAHTYTYKGLAVDGSDVFTPSSHAGVTTGVTYNACGPGCSGNTSLGSNVSIEMQLDNDSSGNTTIGYYDKYTLTVW